MYSSDSSWEAIEDSLAIPGVTQRRIIHPLRHMINAILYVVDNGVKWRSLPNDFPPWKTVHGQFAKAWTKRLRARGIPMGRRKNLCLAFEAKQPLNDNF